ncbi:hypothetical protein PhaeoP83_02669 [Phaeobacter inhibens]|uniref:Uncharacterized protein n=1 Tax=Phaeobacter inhibens TaxID=221822 RepID=A0ABM6RJ04_9RHOB|nr:hypothetical protein [Phaeobacter inhibens]AUQ50919.1 hypothetical protein PhaeoP83_02669 [Phaeobacter inhibens]AUQ96435.1 hypothetical protein PhaeoP66_03705 [Phaeobacter inhibens]AUR20724.1 hypothetical protein PhaeoP80_02669 [Phaeobacter inhibens]
MSDTKPSGPQSQQEAVNLAQQTKNLPAGGYTNTNGWSATAKTTFGENGGR